jgi:protein SCO1
MSLYKTTALLFMLIWSSVSAQFDKPVPGEYTPSTPEKYKDGIVNPKQSILNTTLPVDILFKDETGKELKLSDLFDGSKPTLLCMMYFKCQSTCGPLINEIYSKIKDLNLKPGKDFNLVFISMDPKEDHLLAGPKKESYLQEFNYSNGEGQYFLTSDQLNVKAITKALDFQLRAIGEGDFSHPTVTYFITPDAKISRFLTGFGYNPQDIKFSLLDAGQGKVGSLLDNILIRCYTFDPKNKGYVRNSMVLMSIAGAITLLSMVSFLGLLWYQDLKKNKKKNKINSIENK